ncbi:hypothetical protein C0Q70_07218 [Pomacea canaliculata]|uniref:C-type lectin domain-containing protein n=1 Tax=Pomacea canaliculata TaxID=400727 RepID=A0A2T7PEF9_POMCA|nr:hypothetical protein C0Q70_07218 [Pomacea canaliculata]
MALVYVLFTLILGAHRLPRLSAQVLESRGEPPATTDRKLLVNKMLSTGSDAVRLTCGHFTSLGFPAVSAVWKDPQGKIIPSEGFKEQVFYLDLPLSSAVSGNYCCHLDCRAHDFAVWTESPLRQWRARCTCQTDTVEEVRKVDCPSLDSFSHLQQQVLDMAASLRELQELESTANSSREALETRLEQMSRAMNDHQNRTDKHYADFEKESKETLADLQTQMDNKLARVEGKLTLKVSELATTTAENLTRSAQDLSSLEVRSASEMSELKSNLSTIQDTLTSHVTSTSQLHDSLRSDVAKLIRTTQSLKSGISFNERCIKVSNDSVDYQTAKANCLYEEAHLVILTSRDVDGPVLRGVLTASGITLPSPPAYLFFWVGADDMSTEGSFVWNDGSPLLTSSSLWYTDEPNNSGDNEDCVQIKNLCLLHEVVFFTPDTGGRKRTDIGNSSYGRNGCGLHVIILYLGTISLLARKDTRGNILPSDGFEEQVFYLDLPLSSAVSGDYCCHLDCRAPDFCCLDPQSPLRQCAPVHVQTDTVEEVRKVDCPSLDSFSRLQQQVLDLAASLRELQESESQSGVATIAQLVQRQAKCDQLDVYMTRVEDLEKETKKKIDELETTMGDKLSTIERNVSLQLLDLTTIMPEDLTDYYQALASLDLKTTAQITALEQNVSDIKDALTSHVTNSTQSIADAWSDVVALFKTTESLKDSKFNVPKKSGDMLGTSPFDPCCAFGVCEGNV